MEHLVNIEADIAWLSTIIEERVKQNNFNFDSIKPDDLKKGSVYSDFIKENRISNEERLLLILALVPHIYPVYLHNKFNTDYMNPDHSSSIYFIRIHPSNYILQNNEKIRVKSIPVSGFEVGDRPVDWPGNQE